MSWSDDCPSRGPALSHAHWRDCLPEETHPGTNRSHPYTVCCHCEQVIGTAEQVSNLTATEHPDAGPQADHLYVPTLVGMCLRCHLPPTRHPTVLKAADEREEQADLAGLPITCDIDHRSITRRLLIGDAGYEWTRCPRCNVQLEGSPPEDTSPTGRYRRRQYGPGRLPFTQRHWAKIERLKRSFEGGYYLS